MPDARSTALSPWRVPLHTGCAVVLALLLSACGYKGPLYMPPPPAAPNASLTTPPPADAALTAPPASQYAAPGTDDASSLTTTQQQPDAIRKPAPGSTRHAL